jgi:hypothetical protein
MFKIVRADGSSSAAVNAEHCPYLFVKWLNAFILGAKPYPITAANCATPHDGRINADVALIVLDGRA